MGFFICWNVILRQEGELASVFCFETFPFGKCSDLLFTFFLPRFAIAVIIHYYGCLPQLQLMVARQLQPIIVGESNFWCGMKFSLNVYMYIKCDSQNFSKMGNRSEARTLVRWTQPQKPLKFTPNSINFPGPYKIPLWPRMKKLSDKIGTMITKWF